MKFGPGFYETPLSCWQGACNEIDRVDTEYSDCLLIVGVKMRNVMRSACFSEHTNNDPKEPAEFRH